MGVEYTKGMSLIPWMVMAAGSVAADYTNPISYQDTPEPAHHFRVQFENDSAFNQDRNYSHGTRLDYAQSFSRCREIIFGASLTQNIYTPETHTTHANRGEHPYAGSLTLGGAVMFETDFFGQTSELQVGVMGKHSYAKEAQNNLHDLMGMETWDGWRYQVPSEMIVQYSQRNDFNIPISSPYADGLVFTRMDIGNMRLGAGLGAAFRIGKNLPQNMQVVGNDPANYSVGILSRPDYNPKESSYFLLMQAELRYVARDFSVDGGMFHHFDSTCSREPWQATGVLGFGVVRHNIEYFAGGVLQSRTYGSQEHNSLYGTFSVSWNW